MSSLGIPAQIDRAIQSNNLSDILVSISQCSKAIRDNPFPLFVNSLLLRLAELFQGDKLGKLELSINLIRLRIVKLLRECHSDLHLAFSSDEIVRRVMKVSHSNDYRSRSLTMLFLAAVAPVVHANKKVHYLLMEGLDCDDTTELMSAVLASGSLARISSEFSTLVVQKIGGMITQPKLDTPTKVRLLNDLSFYQQNLAVTKYSMDLGRYLLRNNPEQEISVAVISSLTTLAKRNGLLLTEQISLILDETTHIDGNEALLTCCLTNLLELAQTPHQWSPDQVVALYSLRDKVLSYRKSSPLVIWLRSLNCLAKHVHVSTFSNTDFFNHLMPLVNVDNATVKIYLIEVIYSHLEKFKNSESSTLLGNCLNNLMIELANKNCSISLEDRIKFYNIIATYIRHGNASLFNIDELTTAEFLMQIDNTFPEPVFIKTLETLNYIAELKLDAGRSVCSRALRLLRNSYGKPDQKQFSDAPLELYSLAFLPFPQYSDKRIAIIEQLLRELKTNKRWWFAYKLARIGFRHGHWAEIAAPLLEEAHNSCVTVETSTYISALIYLTGVQIPKKLTVPTLDLIQQNLRQASFLLMPLLQNSSNFHNFVFAAGYIDCLSALFAAFNTVLMILNMQMGTNAHTLQYVEYAKTHLEKAREQFSEARQKWALLYRRYFDADDETLQHVELWSRYCMLFESVITRITSSDEVKLAPIPLTALSAANRQLESLVNWGIEQTNENVHPITGSTDERLKVWRSNFSSFDAICEYLTSINLKLPRYFFQQLHHTKIKLNISPQPRDKEPTLVLNTNQLALSVEGVIETTNPKHIQNITVNVRVYADKNSEPKISDDRQCQVHDNYFKVQFLLNIEKTAEIVTSIMFTDLETKRTWEAPNPNKFKVTAPEIRE